MQRVTRASVTVDDRIVGAIEAGLCVFVGVTHDDTTADAQKLATKVAGLRVFEDEDGGMNASLTEYWGAALVVSQFTLYGDTRKGRRPSWSEAARPEHAEPRIEDFVQALRETGTPVETGVFRADMRVELVNDGPVTLMVEVPNR